MNERNAAYRTLSHLEKTRSTTAAVWMLPSICCCLFTECWLFPLLIKDLMQPHPAPITLHHCWGELLSRQITSLDKDSKQNNFWLHVDMFTPINTHTQTAWLPSTETLLLVLSFLQKFTWIHYLISSARKNFGAKLLGQNDHLIVLSNKSQKNPQHIVTAKVMFDSLHSKIEDVNGLQ